MCQLQVTNMSARVICQVLEPNSSSRVSEQTFEESSLIDENRLSQPCLLPLKPYCYTAMPYGIWFPPRFAHVL